MTTATSTARACLTATVMLTIAAVSGCIPPTTQGCSDIDALTRSSGKPGDVIAAVGTINVTHRHIVTIGDVTVPALPDALRGVLFEVPELPPNLYVVTIQDIDCPQLTDAVSFPFGIVAP